MSRKDKLYFIAWIIIISLTLIIFQLLLYSKGFYAISADEAGHTLEAYKWYRGQATFFSIWLPFQKILYGIGFSVYYNIFWVPRILSSLFGLLTVLSVMFLTYELFQNRTISILAGFLSAVFSCVVIFSVIPMTEIYYSFFTISSIAFLYRWKRKGSNVSLIFLILFSGIGTTIRYEAWVFSILIFFIIIFEIHSANEKSGKKLINISAIFLLMFAFPIVWICLSYITTGDVTSFLHSVSERYLERKVAGGIRNNVLYHFLIINLLSLNILGLLTLSYFSRKETETKIYALIFFTTLLLMALITFITKAMPTHNAWRLASIWSIMLIPFTARWLYILLSDKNDFPKYNFALFAILLLYFFNVQTLKYTGFSFTSREDLTIGKYIRNELNNKGENSKIFIERMGWNYTNLLVTSQQPDRFITEDHFKNNFENSDSVSSQQVEEYKKAEIEYLILTYRMNPNFGMEYMRELKKFNNWTIYELR